MGWGLNLYQLARIPIRKVCKGYYLRWYYNGWHYWFFLPGVYTVVTEGEKYRTYGTRKIALSSGQVNRSEADGIRTIMFTREISLLTIAGWMSIRIERDTITVYDNKVSGAEIEFIMIIGSKEVSVTTGFTPVPYIPVVPPSVTYCEIVIGTQIWMCYNWDSAFPGSRVYNDDEANRSIYGGLYNYNQAVSPGFVPAGWHVPTLDDWMTLINYVGSLTTAGGILKQAGTTHWLTPNTGAIDTYGFAVLGGGQYGLLGMGYNYELIQAYFLTATESTPGYAHVISMDYASAIAVDTQVRSLQDFCSVRLLKDVSSPLPGAYKYGLLYNWWAVNDARLFFNTGWHVPSTAEWETMVVYLGGAMVPWGFGGLIIQTPNVIGDKLKEVGTTYWLADIGSTNSSGFNGRGGGVRGVGGFGAIRISAFYYCSDDINLLPWHAYGLDLSSGSHNVANWTPSGKDGRWVGMSIRGIKDSTTLTNGQTGVYIGNDGKAYRTICIDTQEWIADNLAETKYRNGDTIPEVTNDVTWAALVTGALCAYNNDWSNV